MTNPPASSAWVTTKGLPIVISAPSGAGKSTIAARIAQENPRAVLSVSCTTRDPRPGERDGVDYTFLNEKDFRARISAGEFLEWATVHGQLYGTPLRALHERLNEHRDVILTIDPQGALSVKKFFPTGVFIFVVPPSWEVLLKRLYKRATDNSASMELRIANARKELSYLPHYDYLVVNDDLEKAVRDVSAIISAEHQRLARIDKASIPIFAEDI